MKPNFEPVVTLMKAAVPAPASQEIRDYFESVLPTLTGHALSELCRTNASAPRLVGFMADGSMGIINIADALGGFGDLRSKNVTAVTHKLGAITPGCKASVFCVETWIVESKLDDAAPDGISDHPDREDAMMFNLLHYEPATGELMQLIALLKVLKVFSARPDRTTWAGTTFGPCKIIDPMVDRMTGRFVASDRSKGAADGK